MKKLIAVLTILLCVFGTSTAFARGYDRGYHGGHGKGHGGRHYVTHSRPHYYNHHRGGYGHYDNGLGIVVGVAGGLLLGTALANSAPPRTVVVQQPSVCFENRVSHGEWQVDPHGRQVWMQYSYPVTQRVQIPCY